MIAPDYRDRLISAMDNINAHNRLTNIKIPALDIFEGPTAPKIKAALLRLRVADALVDNGFEAVADRFKMATEDIHNIDGVFIVASSYVIIEEKIEHVQIKPQEICDQKPIEIHYYPGSGGGLPYAVWVGENQSEYLDTIENALDRAAKVNSLLPAIVIDTSRENGMSHLVYHDRESMNPMVFDDIDKAAEFCEKQWALNRARSLTNIVEIVD